MKRIKRHFETIEVHIRGLTKPIKFRASRLRTKLKPRHLRKNPREFPWYTQLAVGRSVVEQTEKTLRLKPGTIQLPVDVLVL